MMRYFLCLFSAIIFLAACSKKTVPAATAFKESAGTVVSSGGAAKAAEGKNIYLSKCGRCHVLKNTSDYTSQQWIPIMDRMAVKANLDDAQKTNVLLYVQAYAKK